MMSTTTLLLTQQQQKKQDDVWDGGVTDYYGNMFVIPRESQNNEYMDEYHDMGGLGIYSDNNLQFNFDMLQLSSPQQQQQHHRRHTMSEGEELPLPIFHNSMKDFATLHHPLKTVNPKEIINSFPDDDANQKNKTDFWMMQGEAIGAIATWLDSNDELKQELTPPLHLHQPQPVVQPPTQNRIPDVVQEKTVSVSPRPVQAVARRKRGSVSIPLKPTISRRKRTKSMDLHTPHHSPLLSNVSFTAIDDTPATTTTTSSRATSPTLSDDMEKQFQCQHCTKKFRRSEHLKRHNRSVHSNDRPFHCSYCDKKFSRSDNLSQHLRTHRKD